MSFNHLVTFIPRPKYVTTHAHPILIVPLNLTPHILCRHEYNSSTTTHTLPTYTQAEVKYIDIDVETSILQICRSNFDIYILYMQDKKQKRKSLWFLSERHVVRLKQRRFHHNGVVAKTVKKTECIKRTYIFSLVAIFTKLFSEKVQFQKEKKEKEER